MHKTKPCVLTAASLLLATGTLLAEETYTLPAGDTTNGVDLTAMTGFYADRINGPKSGAANLTGGLTVAADANPFTIYLQGGRINFRDSSRLENYPVVVRNADGVTARSQIEIDSSIAYHDYTLGANVRQIIPYTDSGKWAFQVAGEGMTSATLKVDGEFYGYSKLIVGTDRGNANVIVGKTGSIYQDGTGYDIYLGYQKAAFPTGRTMMVVMDLQGKLSCRHLSMGVGMNEYKYDSCVVTNRGAMTVRQIQCPGGGQNRLVFDGGTLEVVTRGDITESSPIFYASGMDYKSGYPNPRLFVYGVNGNPIDITTVSNRTLCGGWDYRPIKFMGSGGFVKRGAGILTFAHNGSWYWDSVSTRFDTTGETTVKGGGLKLIDTWFTPGRGRLVLEGEGTTYDLNGVTQRDAFTGATGLGTIVNTSTTTATLTFGYNNASDDLDVAIGEKIGLKKIGSGTLTVGAKAAAFAGNLTVSNGTVKLATDLTRLGTVTIAKGTTLDVRGRSFACAALVNDGQLLTDAESSVSIGGEEANELSLPAQLTSFEKTGSGTLTTWGACTVSDTVTVADGTLLVRPRDYNGKYYRIRLYENTTYPKRDCQKLSEFTFVDADGARIAIPNCFWNPIDGSTKPYGGLDGINDASTLQECETQLWGKGGGYYQLVKTNEGPEKLFDNNIDTVHAWWYYWAHGLSVVVRLPNDAPAVAGYKMTRGTSGEAPITWSFEGSLDGKTWTMLDKTDWDLTDTNQLEAAKAVVPATKTEYNGGIPYRLTALTNTSFTPFGSLTPVKIAAGAVYAASDPSTRLDALSVDFAEKGSGTVSNFTVAANGKLTIANYPEGAESVEVPLDLVATTGLDGFKSWQVVSGGEIRSDLRVRYRKGKLLVLPREGLFLIVR